MAALRILSLFHVSGRTFEDQCNALIDEAIELAKDGITVKEAGQLVMSFIQIAVGLAVNGLSVDGLQKHTIVQSKVGVLIQSLLPYVALPWWASWIPGVMSFILPIVAQVTSGLTEAAYQKHKAASPEQK